MSAKSVFLALVLCVGLLSPYLWAQTAPVLPQLPAPPDRTLSGNDIGFRVESTKNGRAMGRLMVRVNGVWMEAEVLGRAGMVPLKN